MQPLCGPHTTPGKTSRAPAGPPATRYDDTSWPGGAIRAPVGPALTAHRSPWAHTLPGPPRPFDHHRIRRHDRGHPTRSPAFWNRARIPALPQGGRQDKEGEVARIGLQRQRARLHHAHRAAPRPAQPPCPASAASTGRPPPIRFRDLRHFTVAPPLEQCVDLAANKELIDHAPHRRHRHRLRPCPTPPPARRHRLPRPRPRLSLTYVRQRRRTPRCPPPLPSTTAVNPARSPDT